MIETLQLTEIAPNQWEGLDGHVYIGREGQTLESFLEELSAPVVPGVTFANLEPDQFWFAVRASGYEPDLLAWVAAMNEPESPTYDPVGWAAASAKLQFAKFFERYHPFVEAAREAIGMSSAELDALWQFASA